MGKGRFILVVALILLGFGAFAYFAFQSPDLHKLIKEPYAQAKKCQYDFINPQRCEPDLAPKKKEYVVLKNEIVDILDQAKKDGKLTSAGVYFRDLENGPILEINAQEDYIPASLLKLPLMITYYKKAQDDPSLLSRKVTVQGDVQSLAQNISPGQSAQIGQTYTIDQLIGLLITQSDNTSWKVLLNDLRQHYSEDDFVSTLSDLGIVDPRKRSDQQYVNVQTYAAIFRMLYNSSYLNFEMSDKALKLLTQTEYKDGLVAGLPDNVMVAHKFGEQKNGEEQQLHDCGVVYYQPDPYVICVMTKGTQLSDLSPIIKQISQKVYAEVKLRNDEDNGGK